MMDLLNRQSKIGFENHYFALFIISILYALSIQYVLSAYASPNWPYFSFPYSPPQAADYLLLFGSVAIISFFVPKYYDRPSNLVLIFVYIFVIVPVIVASSCMSGLSDSSYYLITIVAVILFSTLCLSLRSDKTIQQYKPRTPRPIFEYLVLGLFFIVYTFLVYRFGAIMNLVGLDDLYQQRAVGAATNVIDGYAQAYGQYVLSTAMVAIGLYRKKSFYVLCGIAGSIISYAITAEKAGLLYPIFVAILYFLISRKNLISRSGFILIAGCAVLNFMSVFLFPYINVFEIICINFGVRTTLVPGVFVMHYYDFFSSNGFTHFSQIRGFDFIVETPPQYILDSRWPSLGLILGEDYIQYPNLNANANFIATDGIASFGLVGICVPFILLWFVLKIFDSCARGIDISWSLPIMVPIALTLSNASVFSIITSFGGFFWMLMFRFMFVEKQL